MGTYRSLQERLCTHSIKEGDCSIWVGYCQKVTVSPRGEDGSYGRINLTWKGRSLKFPVHRVAKVLEELLLLNPCFNFYSKEDKELFFDLYTAYSACSLSIDHLCGRTLCFNPDHLEWVHLTVNQRRKKWSNSVRRKKIGLQKSKETRHYRSLLSSSGVKEWVKKIRSRQFRVT